MWATMCGVGKHTNESVAREQREDPGPSNRTTLLLALGVTVTLVAWGVLVLAAIDFGREARGGEAAAWAFLALSTLGAAACLFVTLLLGTRLYSRITGKDADRPKAAPRPQGGRRAAR